jgi:NTP pyrophosphatase (non-canonical NTP hydrolase)
MTLNEYQNKAQVTATYRDKIIYPALGLSGEVGEVNEKIKKVLRDSYGYFSEPKKEEIKKELGDVLWYVQALAFDLGFTLEEVAQCNIDKLISRKERNVIHGNGDNR